jgi:hypothetical protein
MALGIIQKMYAYKILHGLNTVTGSAYLSGVNLNGLMEEYTKKNAYNIR